jgi:hypothetical protein
MEEKELNRLMEMITNILEANATLNERVRLLEERVAAFEGEQSVGGVILDGTPEYVRRYFDEQSKVKGGIVNG